MSDPIQALDPAFQFIRPVLQEKIQRALDGIVCNFRFNYADTGLLTLYIESLTDTPLRCQGCLSVELATNVWRLPYTPIQSSHDCDRVMDAGTYVMRGLKVTSSVALPAYNGNTLELVSLLATAQQFAQVLKTAEQFLDTLLQAEKKAIGERFLAADPVKA